MDIGRGNLRRRRRAPLGCAREREQRARERAESEGEERGGSRGGAWRSQPPSGSGEKQEVARARAGVRRTHASRPSGARWEVTGIGQLGWSGSWAAQVRPGKFSLLSDFYFSFLIFLLFVLT